MRLLSGHPKTEAKDFFSELANYCAEHDVDWDHYGSGDFKEAFEKELAADLGKEAAVFMPSGVMAQLIAMRVWGDRVGSNSVAFHPSCHLQRHEKMAYESLHGFTATLVGETYKVPKLSDLEKMESHPSVMIYELPMRHLGGDLPSWEELLQIQNFCRENKIKLHMDGARLWETQEFYKKSLSEICDLFDSVYVSFYKGIGSTSGAMLFGDREFVEESKIWLRRHGGDLFSLLPLILPAKINYDRRRNLFSNYFKETQRVCEVLKAIDGVELIPETPKTNMFHMLVRGEPRTLIEKAEEVEEACGLAMITGIWEETRPGWSRVEIYIGERAKKIADDEIRDYFNLLFS